MRKRAKVDQTHGEIADAFRACGWTALSLAPLGSGAPDLLVCNPHDEWPFERHLYLIECKTGKGKLRPGQEDFAKLWPVHVLRSAQEAIDFMASH